MKKNQQKIQIILVSVGLFLILITYFYYPYMNKVKLMNGQSSDAKLEDTVDSNEQSTSFKNVEYKGLYDLDKPFTIKSEDALIFKEEPDIVYMNNMHVVLHLKDGRIVNIVSKEGKYNKITYDCSFYKDVKATDGETKIFSQNLDLLATENYAEIYNNVSLIYPAGVLQADKIDYDFETKYFKVSMFGDNSVKMKVIKWVT